MWHSICTLLSEQFQYDYSISEKQMLQGGEVHETYRVSDGKNPVFIKVNDISLLSKFTSELDELRLLKNSETIQVPFPYAVGSYRDKCFILMEFLELSELNQVDAAELGAQLACLHLWGEQLKFGFDEDNWLSSTPQPNGWIPRWDKFFAEQRIGWQLQLCLEKGINFGPVDVIVNTVRDLLAGHHIEPSLLVGDMRLANCASTAQGPVIFDPACYWGDRECDIASSELFAPLPEAFYRAYERISPLPNGYQERKPIYQLYHLLNFCNLFGGHYLEQTQKAIDDLLQNNY